MTTLRGPGRNFTPNETARKLNPHIFGPGPALGTVATREPEQAGQAPLERGGQERQGGQGGLVRYRVSLTVHRCRLLDAHDNLRAALKPLADAIAQSLHGGTPGQHDALVEWEYGQQETRGEEGVAVRIEVIEKK